MKFCKNYYKIRENIKEEIMNVFFILCIKMYKSENCYYLKEIKYKKNIILLVFLLINMYPSSII